MSIQTMKEDINNLINNICQNVTGGELKQLGELFTSYFLGELSKIIYNNECAEYSGLLINVDSELCWIDKAPYAKLCDGKPKPFDTKVELGDAMFIFEEELVEAYSQKTLNKTSKAFILQAKVTKKEKKDDFCKVPIARYNPSKKDSTYKEFELYKGWPCFDIYYAANSNKSKESNINLINDSTDSCRFAWYGVAASTRNSLEWPCRWMAGKAKMNFSCDITLGELLSSFYKNQDISGSQVGEYFEDVNNPNSAWGKVVYHVLECSNQLRKPSYFPSNVTTKNRIISLHKTFIAFQLNQLFSSFGINNKISTYKLLDLSCYLLRYMEKILLNSNVSSRDCGNLLKGVVDILQSLYNPIALKINGEYKPKKFPIIRVTVKRQKMTEIQD